MGKKKHLEEIENLFKKSKVVDADSIKRIIRNKKNIKHYHKQLLKNLIKQKKIYRITKGYYTIHDDASLIVFCFKPAYLGLQNAMSFHNLWEQETNPVIITTRKLRLGVRSVFGRNVLIRRISSKYFFGFEYYKEGDFYFPYSDIEKTFIDMVYFRQYLDKENIASFKKKIDKKKLKEYLKRYPEKIRKRVLSVLGKKLRQLFVRKEI